MIYRMAVYFLIILSLLIYFFNLGAFQVWQPNEAFYADASRRMLETKDFITPIYNGELRLEKPPLTYWLISLGFYIFGVNEFALRFFHALLGLGTGLLSGILAWLLTKNLKTALLSFLVVVLSLQFFANAHYASPEVPLAFFIALTLILWYGYYRTKNTVFLVLAFLSSSLGMLVKGPVAFVMPALIIFIFLLIEDRKEILNKKYYLLTPFALILGLWWHIYQALVNGSQFLNVFLSENFKRVYTGEDPIYFYLLDTLISFLPYSVLFFPALLWAFSRRELRFVVVWTLSFFLVFSLIKQKIPVYVMPAYPSMAVITAHFLMEGPWERLKRLWAVFVCSLFSLVILLGVFYFDLAKGWVLLSLVPPLALLFERKLAPLFGAIIFYLFLLGAVLPYLEGHRHYRELGSFIRELDPKGELKTYQVGYFNHNLPFYAKRKVIRDQTPEKDSIVVFELGSFDRCAPLKTFELYKGSESRLFKFMLDTKRNKNFSQFGVCLYF
jgi:4-amino-4-deoxy-L-arabinose transferase and related glycosyltransferases of PMT family